MRRKLRNARALFVRNDLREELDHGVQRCATEREQHKGKVSLIREVNWSTASSMDIRESKNDQSITDTSC